MRCEFDDSNISAFSIIETFLSPGIAARAGAQRDS
jgi:hypothetical protein